MPHLDPNNVPLELMSLLPMAEKWGISDDFEREQAVSKASLNELNQLIHCSDEISDEDFDGWLTGPEALSQRPSPEYIAITNLTMAMEYAKTELKARSAYD